MDTSILHCVEHPIFVLQPDEEGLPRYTAFNSYACRVLGKPEAEIIGLTAKELYGGRLGNIAFRHHCDALTSGEPRVYEILLPIEDRQMLVRTSLCPVRDASGRVIRIVGSSLDVSGNRLLREMQAEAHTMQNEMEDFINLAAHDLRAPMRNVSQIAQMLREDFEDHGDGKLELIDLLTEVGEKAMALIGDVLSQAQAGSAAEQTVDFDFGELVEEIMILLDPQQRCVVAFDSGLVSGDRTAVQIILRNLLENAIKHGQRSTAAPGRGGPHVQISLADRQDGFFEVSILDSGKGFDDPALLFLEKGKLRTGSGFGLFGVRRLIHARGGELSVTNRGRDSGAEIVFRLPGAAAPELPSQPKVVQEVQLASR